MREVVSELVRTDSFQDLTRKAAKVVRGRKDRVIARVYSDLITNGNIVTRGEIVVPGEETLRAFPRTSAFPFHFRKTFTPESRPIKRGGETPQIEFEKTKPIHRAFPRHVPEPLGYDEWTYRCTTVCGQPDAQRVVPIYSSQIRGGAGVNPRRERYS